MPSGQRRGYEARIELPIQWHAGPSIPDGADFIGMVMAFGVTAIECYESPDAHRLRVVAPSLGTAFGATFPKATGGTASYGVLGRYPGGGAFWAQSVTYTAGARRGPGESSAMILPLGAVDRPTVLPFGMIVRRRDAKHLTVLLLKPPTVENVVCLDGIKVVFSADSDPKIEGVCVTFRNGKYQSEKALGQDRLAKGITWQLVVSENPVAQD